MSIDVVYEKVVSAEIKNDNSSSGFPEILKDISVSSTQEMIGKITEELTELLEKNNIVSSATRYRLSNVTSGAFLGLDIALNYKEKGVVQATFTAITAAGTSAAVCRLGETQL